MDGTTTSTRLLWAELVDLYTTERDTPTVPRPICERLGTHDDDGHNRCRDCGKTLVYGDRVCPSVDEYVHRKTVR